MYMYVYVEEYVHVLDRYIERVSCKNIDHMLMLNVDYRITVHRDSEDSREMANILYREI